MAAMEEALLKRVLPHSIEAEQSVIGAMIMDGEAIMVIGMQLWQHRKSWCRKIFTANRAEPFLKQW